MTGFILLSRSIQDKSIWSDDPSMLKFWLYILLKANYNADKVYELGSVKIRHGEVLKSYRKIADENEYVSNNRVVRWSTSRIARMLSLLEKSGRITYTKTELGTLIHINNFAKYQAFDSYKARLGTAKKQQQHNIKEVKEVKELWKIFLEELGGTGKQPSLTAKRKQILGLLFTEQLDPTNYEEEFRGILKAVKGSEHHMKERAYQMPESLFRNEERRERWALKGSEKKYKTKTHSVSRNQWSVEV